MALGENRHWEVKAPFPVLCWSGTILTGMFVLPGSTDLTEAEKAEIETIRQHRQELLDDIQVRTIMFLVCLAF